MRGDGDGWVRCSAGHRHWGRHGAAGLLLRDRDDGRDRVVLQHRAWWSHQGGTWGVPGGARDSGETAIVAALRETGEEAGIEPAAVRPIGLLLDDHGGWSYSTVVGEPTRAGATPGRPAARARTSAGWTPTRCRRCRCTPASPRSGRGCARRRPRWCWWSTPPTWSAPAARGDGWWRDRPGATRAAAGRAGAAGRRPLPRRAAGRGRGRAARPRCCPPSTVVVEGAARAVLDGEAARPGRRGGRPRRRGRHAGRGGRGSREAGDYGRDHRGSWPADPTGPRRDPGCRAVLADRAGGRPVTGPPDPAVSQFVLC